MGCLTGFYLILKGNRSPREITPLILNAFRSVKEAKEVPGATPVNCGSYLMHDLAAAKRCAAEFTDYLEKNAGRPEIYEYPRSERFITSTGQKFYDS